MSRYSLYFHIVWATMGRQAWLTPAKEEAVFRCALNLISELGYAVLAINGTPDHVHLLLQTGPSVDLAVLIKKVKGVTSALLNDMTDHDERFRWQEGYFAATVSPSHLSRALAYVQNQKEHHRANTTHHAWEETGEQPEPH
jgi:putative transposase